MEWERSYQKDCRQPETSPSRNPPSVAAACLLACLLACSYACQLGTRRYEFNNVVVRVQEPSYYQNGTH